MSPTAKADGGVTPNNEQRTLQIEYWDLARLIPYARNARTHSDAQVAEIAGSIQAFGFTNPVLVNEKGDLIAGHARLAAARLLGLGEVPGDHAIRAHGDPAATAHARGQSSRAERRLGSGNAPPRVAGSLRPRRGPDCSGLYRQGAFGCAPARGLDGPDG